MKEIHKKIILLLMVCLIFMSYFYFDLNSYFQLEMLQESRDSLVSFYEKNTLEVIFVFFIVYVLMAAFSLPGAAIMTLASGALFGFTTGLIIASFASSIGAVLATVVSRYILRDWVEKKFGDKLQKINEGIKKEGAFYLFSLRLIPLFPFFVINLVFGLTKMNLFTYYWVSQIGMLPGTAVYVLAGVQLSQVTKISDIFSFELILVFILLGIFPLLAKKGLYYYRKYWLKETKI